MNRLKRYCSFLILFLPGYLPAQDTIRVKHSDFADEYCWLTICSNQKVNRDTIPLLLILGESKAELRMNKNCPRLKKNDVFVASFEVELTNQKGTKAVRSESSFFSEKQKALLKEMSPGDTFVIKNIVLHAPDGFRSMEDIKITVN